MIRSLAVVFSAVALFAIPTLFLGTAGCGEVCSGGDCQCPDGETCDVGCAEGDCSQQCAPGATCVFECEGGGCRQQCSAGADCTFHCGGGSCIQECSSDQCDFDCTGNGCTSNQGLGEGAGLPY